MALDVGLAPNEHEDLVKARDAALAALHGYADDLEKRLPKMVDFAPMGEANYNYYLKHVLLLPLNAAEVEMIGRTELARYRALEALLPDPKLADPDPKRAAQIPPDQDSFLKAYESREAEMISFLKDHHLVTLPDYLGPFQIRQLPDAFKPTSPGGFMNPPGVYDKDPTGFYFIPTYNPESKNFYIRAAIEDPRPILGHEGIPGHFLQLSIANHLSDEIRRQHEDTVFIEGWALVRRRDADANRPLSEQLTGTGANPAFVALSRRAHRRGRKSAHRPMEFRTSGQIFHGRRRAGSRSGRRRSSGCSFRTDSKNQLHHRQMADHEFARALQGSTRREFPARPIPR